MTFETPLVIGFAVAFVAIFNRKRIAAAFAERAAKRAAPAVDVEQLAIDDAALTELITILSRDRRPAIDIALTGCAHAARVGHDPLWWDATLDALVNGGAVTSFDWKQFESYERDALTADLPFAAAVKAMPIAEGSSVEDKLRTLDTECRPFGYRLLLPPTQDDSYRAVFISSDRFADARALCERLGVDAGANALGH